LTATLKIPYRGGDGKVLDEQIAHNLPNGYRFRLTVF